MRGNNARTILRLLRRVLWPVVRSGVPLPRPVFDLGIFWCYNDVLGRRLWFGEPIESSGRVFFQSYLAPGMVFVDIGANQGLYTILAARRCGQTGQVVAVEPCRVQRQRLRWNLRWNGLRGVRVRGEAVGSSKGLGTLHVVQGPETQGNSLRPPAPDIAQRWKLETVSVITLDDLCEEEKISGEVDVIKIDVEGGEQDVLRGAKRSLAFAKRPLIYSEVCDRRTRPWGYSAREIVLDLLGRDFSWWEVATGTIMQHVIQNEYPGDNLLAVPREREEAFVARMKSLGWRVIGTSDG